MLGFRNATYNVESTTVASESLPNINSTKYIYLAFEEFNKNKQNSFTTPLSKSLLDENGNPLALNGLDYSFCLEIEHI